MKRFFCISALFLCAACANDLGNYDYRDLTEPDITGIEANISVLTHARLQLTPDLGRQRFPGRPLFVRVADARPERR